MMAALEFCKDVCPLISGNSGMQFYFIKEDVGLRVTDDGTYWTNQNSNGPPFFFITYH